MDACVSLGSPGQSLTVRWLQTLRAVVARHSAAHGGRLRHICIEIGLSQSYAVLNWELPDEATEGFGQPPCKWVQMIRYLFQFLFTLHYRALSPLPSCSSQWRGRVPLLKPKAVLVPSAIWEAG